MKSFPRLVLFFICTFEIATGLMDEKRNENSTENISNNIQKMKVLKIGVVVPIDHMVEQDMVEKVVSRFNNLRYSDKIHIDTIIAYVSENDTFLTTKSGKWFDFPE